MVCNTACFDLYSTQNAKPHYVVGKPEDDIQLETCCIEDHKFLLL